MQIRHEVLSMRKVAPVDFNINHLNNMVSDGYTTAHVANPNAFRDPEDPV
jgi:hypothetical protein